MMNISKRAAVATLTAAALAGSATTAVTAAAHQSGHDRGGRHDQHHGRHDGDHGRRALSTPLVPSIPTDPPLMGAAPGAVPWVLKSSEATVRTDGRMRVDIRGLLIPSGQFAGTTGPVMTVSASLYCAGNSTPVGTSAAVPLSSHGNARIDTTVALPAKCQIPAVLIHPNGALASYIASSGVSG
jgi:hypothetical protein